MEDNTDIVPSHSVNEVGQVSGQPIFLNSNPNIMLKFLLFSISLFSYNSLAAQINHQIFFKDSLLKTINLQEVIVTGYRNTEYRKRITHKNIQLIFNNKNDTFHHGWDSTYFLTRIEKLDSQQIKLGDVICRLKSFDTSKFVPQLVVFQINKGDTILKKINICCSNLLHRGRLTLNLNDSNIILGPTEFYLGYGFLTKNRETEFSYKLFATDKGHGMLLVQSAAGIHFEVDKELPCIFPFTISYRRFP
ncbi:MAG: hypothetical protein JST21_19060 [Bacteroidetes bacterium]|nr:hypothetical protein [Bacteroidota bacterium]